LHARNVRGAITFRKPFSVKSSRGSSTKHSLSLDEYPADIQRLATSLNDARAKNRQVSDLPTQDDRSLNQAKAYQVAAAIQAIRVQGGERPVGRKIGFTNRNIWPQYNIDASNWSYMYDRTVVDLQGSGRDVIDISNMSNLEPKLEPEIIFGLKKAPESGMTDLQLLECIEWVSHGFEVVQSIFPGWKFTAADTTAAFALHGRLLVSERVPTARLGSPANALEQLKNFDIDLIWDGDVIDRGTGANVLGSPINALRHLCDLLEKDEWNPPLASGEIVTTGTLTGAWAIEHGSTWKTKVTGLGVSGLECSFKVQSRS